MANCRLDASTRERAHWKREVGRWVDGESSRPDEVALHVVRERG